MVDRAEKAGIFRPVCRRCGEPATHALVDDVREPTAARFACAEHLPIRGITRERLQTIDLRAPKEK